MKYAPKSTGGKRTSGPPPAASSTSPSKIRFASDNFNYNLTLDKSAPYWHEPLANLGVVLGSGPMMFFVGTMGFANNSAMGAAASRMTPDRPPSNIIGG